MKLCSLTGLDTGLILLDRRDGSIRLECDRDIWSLFGESKQLALLCVSFHAATSTKVV